MSSIFSASSISARDMVSGGASVTYILVIAADVEHQTVGAAVDVDVSLQCFVDHAVGNGLGTA